MRKMEEVEQPLNANERYLSAVCVRLEVLIEQVSSIVEHLASQANVAVVESKVEEVVEVAPKSRKRSTK